MNKEKYIQIDVKTINAIQFVSDFIRRRKTFVVMQIQKQPNQINEWVENIYCEYALRHNDFIFIRLNCASQ